MTCIIGLEHDGHVYIGGDSCAASGWEVRPMVSPKVFVRDELCFGYTSSFRFGQLLQYQLQIPLYEPPVSDMNYVCRELANGIQDLLKARGYGTTTNAHDEGGTVLLGWHGGLYRISDDYGVVRNADGVEAIGAGSAYALGAMLALKDVEHAPVARIQRALEITARLCGAVLPPFKVVSV